MQSLTRRPLLLAGLVFGVVLVALLAWILFGDALLDPGVYTP